LTSRDHRLKQKRYGRIEWPILPENESIHVQRICKSIRITNRNALPVRPVS